jgi:hypothetical protein
MGYWEPKPKQPRRFNQSIVTGVVKCTVRCCDRHGSVNDTHPEEAEHEARTRRDLDALLSSNHLPILACRAFDLRRAQLVYIPTTQTPYYTIYEASRPPLFTKPQQNTRLTRTTTSRQYDFTNGARGLGERSATD